MLELIDSVAVLSVVTSLPTVPLPDVSTLTGVTLAVVLADAVVLLVGVVLLVEVVLLTFAVDDAPPL